MLSHPSLRSQLILPLVARLAVLAPAVGGLSEPAQRRRATVRDTGD